MILDQGMDRDEGGIHTAMSASRRKSPRKLSNVVASVPENEATRPLMTSFILLASSLVKVPPYMELSHA